MKKVDTKKGVVIIVLTDKYWSEGYDGEKLMKTIIKKSKKLKKYEEIGICEFSNIYIAR